jgi:hypothetical protein
MEIGIVIQGPTTYVNQILEPYKDYYHIIWSTWEDEPEENVEILKSSGMFFVLNKKPDFTGYWNINLQCTSTYNGVVMLKDKFPNINYFVKIRSDMVIDNLNLFLESVKMSLLKNSICSIGCVKFYPNPLFNSKYFRDFIIAGEYDEMLKFWQPIEFETDGYGKPFPERWLEKRYFGDADYITKKFKTLLRSSFFIKSNGFDITSSKLGFQYSREIRNGINYSKPRRLYSMIRKNLDPLFILAKKYFKNRY